jgi:hypothetical protein
MFWGLLGHRGTDLGRRCSHKGAAQAGQPPLEPRIDGRSACATGSERQEYESQQCSIERTPAGGRVVQPSQSKPRQRR